MEDSKKDFEGDVALKSPLLEKIENFWYHYKWHTVVAAFLLVAILVMSLQMCQKTSYDAYILYAGTHEISRSSADGDTPYNNAVSSLKKVCEDFDGDENVNISLLNLFVLNNKEIEDALEGTTGKEINQALITEDTETLKNTLLFGEYYVCFLSERLFFEYEEAYDGAMFAALKDYTAREGEYIYASERGIYLSSPALSDFYSLPVIAELPEDTVICLRQLSEVSTLFGKEQNETHFKRGESIIKNILSYEK